VANDVCSCDDEYAADMPVVAPLQSPLCKRYDGIGVASGSGKDLLLFAAPIFCVKYLLFMSFWNESTNQQSTITKKQCALILDDLLNSCDAHIIWFLLPQSPLAASILGKKIHHFFAHLNHHNSIVHDDSSTNADESANAAALQLALSIASCYYRATAAFLPYNEDGVRLHHQQHRLMRYSFLS